MKELVFLDNSDPNELLEVAVPIETIERITINDKGFIVLETQEDGVDLTFITKEIKTF